MKRQEKMEGGGGSDAVEVDVVEVEVVSRASSTLWFVPPKHSFRKQKHRKNP